MGDTNSFDLILDFLRRNRFTRAEAALRSELSNRPDLNGFLQKLALEDKGSGNSLEGENGDKPVVVDQSSSCNSGEVSKELIVKEIQCGTGRNGSESKWKNAASTGERNKKVNETAGSNDKGFAFYKGSEDTVLDLYSWKYSSSNGTANPYSAGEASVADNAQSIAKSGEDSFSGEKKTSWVGSTSKVIVEPKYDRTIASEAKELDQQLKTSGAYSKENFTDNLWSRSEEAANSSSEVWKDCPVKTVFPFSKGEFSTGNDSGSGSDKKEGKKKAEVTDIRVAIKGQVDEVGRALYLGKSQGSSEKNTISSLVFPLVPENQKEDFPRLPPVKLKSEDKLLNVNWEEKYDRDAPGTKLSSADNTLLIGSFLDVPVGQEINSAG